MNKMTKLRLAALASTLGGSLVAMGVASANFGVNGAIMAAEIVTGVPDVELAGTAVTSMAVIVWGFKVLRKML